MAKEIALYVVLDANILIRDFWMTGPGFEYLIVHQFLEHRPILPEVAFMEATEHLRRRVTELRRGVEDGGPRAGERRIQLERLFNYKSRSQKRSWNIERLIVRWRAHVQAMLERHHGFVAPPPKVELDEIVERSIRRKKPFSQSDRGFRDTLIWLGILNLLGESARVSFISNNTTDFFDSSLNGPHPDLLAEASQRLSPHHKILFHRSIDDFVAHFDSDRRSSSEALRRAAVSGNLAGFDLWSWLTDNLIPTLGLHEFDMINWAGVPHDAEALVLAQVEEVVSVDVPRVQHLRDNSYRLYCDVGIVGIFECEILFEPFQYVVSPNQVAWVDESDELWTTVGLRVAATFLVRIDFDMATRKVLDAYATPLAHWRSYDDEMALLEEEAKDPVADD